MYGISILKVMVLSQPQPFKAVNGRKLINLEGLDCVSLFSGGLDSAIGVIDFLSSGRKPC
jgi:hypothetical protein